MNLKSSCIAMLALATAVSAQSFSYPTFAGQSGLQLGGNTSVDPNSGNLVVTPNALSQTGRAWTSTPVLVYSGFDTTFQFKVTATGQGADGMSFIIHNAAAGVSAGPGTGTGSDGGYGGNPGIDNALVVELDMYYMSASPYLDTSGNEISIHTMGSAAVNAYETSSVGRVTPAVQMNDQTIHTVRILYVPGTLSVFLDNMVTPVLVTPYDFVNGGTYVNSNTPAPGLNLPNGTAYVGFTGATGGLSQAHEVLNWTWTSAAVAPTCYTGTVGMGALGTPQNVLKVNGSAGGLNHTVNATVFQNISLSFNPYPTAPTLPFVVWAYLGNLSNAVQLPTPYGTLCFFPQLVDPTNPLNVTVTDNIGLGLPGLLPSAPGAWNFTLPGGLPFPTTITFQGAVIDLGTPAITNAVTLNINPAPAPTVTLASPINGNAGTSVTITGTNFMQGAVVTFGGIIANVTSLTATSLTAIVPPGVGCPGTIVVTNPDAQFASRPFNAQPNITGTLFATGPAAGNASFYILGNGFVAGGTTVTVGGASALILTSTATQIICRTPPGVVGQAPVVLTTAQGCTATTTYTYQ